MSVPCFCGFDYPADRQEYWTEEDRRRVAEHQRSHGQIDTVECQQRPNGGIKPITIPCKEEKGDK